MIHHIIFSFMPALDNGLISPAAFRFIGGDGIYKIIPLRHCKHPRLRCMFFLETFVLTMVYYLQLKSPGRPTGTVFISFLLCYSLAGGPPRTQEQFTARPVLLRMRRVRGERGHHRSLDDHLPGVSADLPPALFRRRKYVQQPM